MSAIKEQVKFYRAALKAEESDKLIISKKAALTASIVGALLEQNSTTLRDVLASITDLSGLSDRFDPTGMPGDRWRALSDVLHISLNCGRPLEQLRLALPSAPGHAILRHIQDHPGISIQEFPLSSPVGDSIINQNVLEINKLSDAGLVTIVYRNERYELFLSVIGLDVLESLKPCPAAEWESQNDSPGMSS